MPLTFLVIGIVFLAAGVNVQAGMLFSLLKGDFTGVDQSGNPAPNFLPWMFAVGAIGAVGYIPKLQTFSRLFLVLIVIALLLSKAQFFASLEKAFPGVFPQGATAAAANLAGTQPSVTAPTATSPGYIPF